MKFSDIIEIALSNIKSNLGRAIITMLIIAVGITALVGILTAIDTAIYSLSSNFSSLGANSFAIYPKSEETSRTIRGKKEKKSTPISFKEALSFRTRFSADGTASMSSSGRSGIDAAYKDKESNPVLTLIGVDENDVFTHGDKLLVGRFFTTNEVLNSEKKTVIGHYVAKTLFDNPEDALNRTILVNSRKYKVIGILEEVGSSVNSNADQKVLIPVTYFHQVYGTANSNYKISVSMSSVDQMNDLIDYSTGLMRAVRKLDTREPNNFEIEKSDGIIEDIKENTAILRSAAVFIGLITLLGAAIGLMNILLVSVTERTKEIGIIKALGATKATITSTFLAEALIICQIGGLLGIIMGVSMGYGLSAAFGTDFIIPWNWIILGLVMCTLVGLLAGIYPANKAAQLDPIESLRYE